MYSDGVTTYINAALCDVTYKAKQSAYVFDLPILQDGAETEDSVLTNADNVKANSALTNTDNVERDSADNVERGSADNGTSGSAGDSTVESKTGGVLECEGPSNTVGH